MLQQRASGRPPQELAVFGRITPEDVNKTALPRFPAPL